MKKAMKLVWMVLFALPMISLTACGDDDELIDDNTGATVELKDYSDLIGKSYQDVIKKLGTNYDKDASDAFELVYYNVDKNVTEIDVDFTFFVEDENGETVPNSEIPYEKAVYVDVDVEGFENAYLVNRLQSLYGEGKYNEEDGEIWYTYEKDGKYIIYEYNDTYKEGEITFVDKKEFDKAFPNDTKANGMNLKAYRDKVRANRGK